MPVLRRGVRGGVAHQAPFARGGDSRRRRWRPNSWVAASAMAALAGKLQGGGGARLGRTRVPGAAALLLPDRRSIWGPTMARFEHVLIHSF